MAFLAGAVPARGAGHVLGQSGPCEQQPARPPPPPPPATPAPSGHTAALPLRAGITLNLRHQTEPNLLKERELRWITGGESACPGPGGAQATGILPGCPDHCPPLGQADRGGQPQAPLQAAPVLHPGNLGLSSLPPLAGPQLHDLSPDRSGWPPVCQAGAQEGHKTLGRSGEGAWTGDAANLDLPAQAVNTGGQLHSAESLGVVDGRIRDVSDHGGTTVGGGQGLPQQHGELVVPGGQGGAQRLRARGGGVRVGVWREGGRPLARPGPHLAPWGWVWHPPLCSPPWAPAPLAALGWQGPSGDETNPRNS